MQNWARFNLNDTGMGMYHRAGLAGLTASLLMMKKQQRLPEGIDFDCDERGLIIEGLEPTPESLHRILVAAYELDEDGLFDFPVLHNWSKFQRAELQRLYLGSFLQHPQARTAEKKQRMVSTRIDEETVEYAYLPMNDFRHRQLDTCEKIIQAFSQGKEIEIAGWALPGGVVRHNAVKETGLKDNPQNYFLLLFAPLGCLFFQGLSFLGTGEWDKRTQTLVAVPRPKELRPFAEALVRYYLVIGNENGEDKPLVRALGVKDAALQAAMLLQIKNTNRIRRLSCELTVVRFGTVGWSTQQKTRTGTFTSTVLTEDMVGIYRKVLFHLQRKGKGTHWDYSPFLQQIADNLVQSQEWCRGITAYMTDERRKKMVFWRKELAELVKKEELWTQPIRKEFVEMMHSAIRNRYGKVKEDALKSGADLKSIFSREYDRIRQAFVNCRTQQKFRETLMDFVTRTKPVVSQDNDHSRKELLLFACEADWREGKDLCLLALASYTSFKESDEDN